MTETKKLCRELIATEPDVGKRVQRLAEFCESMENNSRFFDTSETRHAVALKLADALKEAWHIESWEKRHTATREEIG